MKISILIPTFNGANVLSETLRSLLTQSYKNFEIIVCDDNSNDDIVELISKNHDTRIKFFPNTKNLGYPGNSNRALAHCSGEVVFLMGQDDILAKDALKQTADVFINHSEIGAVARPYFAFDSCIDKPIRYKKKLTNEQKDMEIIHISDDFSKVISVFKTLDQLSGLAFKKSLITVPFHNDIFTSHVYIFANIFKNHPIGFLPNYTIAVRVWTSQCKSVSSIYDKSPVKSWIELFNSVYKEENFFNLRAFAIKNFCAKNAVGLIQIRNYSKYPLIYLLREIIIMVKARPLNLIDPLFILVSIGCFVTPKFLLIPLTDWIKENVVSITVPPISFRHD